MTTNRDFEDFFELLNSVGVNYIIIGGVAYNFHAPPRATKDIDIWVAPSPENLEHLISAIRQFGFPTDGLEANDLADNTRVLMLGRVPNRIDILTQPTGVDWDTAWNRRIASKYGAIPVSVLSIDDLVAAKQAAGRPHDLADVATLERIISRTGK